MEIPGIVISIAVLTVAALTANPALASQEEESVKLSGKQRELLLDAQEAYIEKIIRLEADEAIFSNREDRILAGGEIDFKQLREHVRAGNEVMAQIELAEIDALEKISTILDPGQWKWYIHNLRTVDCEFPESEMLEEFVGDDDCPIALIPSEFYDDALTDFTPFSLLLD